MVVVNGPIRLYTIYQALLPWLTLEFRRCGSRTARSDRDLHFPHQNTLDRGPQSFFESTSCSIFLSRLRSATSCLSFLFSSSKVRSRRSSAMPSHVTGSRKSPGIWRENRVSSGEEAKMPWAG